MKVVIVGSGAQGTGLAGLLIMWKDVEQIILADYSQASQSPLNVVFRQLHTCNIFSTHVKNMLSFVTFSYIILQSAYAA